MQSSEQKLPKSQLNLPQTPQKLQNLITEFSNFIQSLLQTLSKQGRRLLTISNLQKTQVFKSYMQNPLIYKFIQHEDYSQLLSKQSYNRISTQVHQKLSNLKQKLKKSQFNQRKREKQEQLKGKKKSQGQQKTTQTSKKNEKEQQNISIEQGLKQFLEIKKNFNNVFREEYFLFMNYRMCIAAKQLQRWTQITSKKTTSDKISKDINSLFQ